LRWVAHTAFFPEGDEFHYARAARLKSSLRGTRIAKKFSVLTIADGPVFASAAASTPSVRTARAMRRNGPRVHCTFETECPIP
jgi:hypothetical protein